ncbi:MAG: CooT family nickel-binding protein [Candidatus Lokiarchaeota archaeon]|nr:CooT family nickel-binding protein [Candidatus Lokiarchaeota archaeon]MBD3201951.1 CooT family nickel-binding protein [Candidatus Lokiarchaeota archaeon]
MKWRNYMCEFKVKEEKEETLLAEEIVVLSYSEENKLELRDILGISEQLDSALILEVNTLNQQCKVVQHPIVKHLIQLMKNLSNEKIDTADIDHIVSLLEDLKKKLK